VTTINPADTVHATTKSICRYMLDRTDALSMLPSSRRDLAAVVVDTEPRYFNYITFGEVDARGYERTRVTLRLDFDRVGNTGQRMVDDEGAVYWTKRLQVCVETSQQMLGVEAAKAYMAHYSAIVEAAADIERQYSGRDLYMLLVTAEEAREQEHQRRRGWIADIVEAECKGLRVGQSRQVMLDVAAKLPGITWPSTWLGIEVGAAKLLRTYDVSVGNVAITATRTK